MSLKSREVWSDDTRVPLGRSLLVQVMAWRIDGKPWWRHQMETFSALLAICAGNSPVPGEFPIQRPVTRSFDVFFDRRLNKRLSKQSWGWWFETQSRPLWRHCHAITWINANLLSIIVICITWLNYEMDDKARIRFHQPGHVDIMTPY